MKALRLLVACGLSAGALMGLQSTAGAAVTSSCNPFLVNADNSTGGAVPGATAIALTLDIGGFGNGVDIPANSSFTLVTPSGPVAIPGTTNTPLGEKTLVGVKNILVDIKVTGAASLGPPSVTGGNVLGPSVNVTSAETLRLTLPGSQNGSTAPGGSGYFPGGQSFTSPEIHTAITVGAAGTTLSGSIVGLQVDAQVDLGAPIGLLAIRLVCTPEANSLGSGNVVAPPVPGTPTATGDTATTNKDTPVVVDVLKNDTPDPALPIDPSSLKVIAGPRSGTTVVNADHTITYTPNAGFVGTDKFTYELCSVASTDPLNPNGCDPADVTITVEDPNATSTAATTTTPTTAAPAAAAELPRTGGSSTPLAMVAGVLVLFGAAASAATRSRRTQP